MTDFYDKDTEKREEVTDPFRKANLLPSMLFNIMVHMNKRAAYTVTNTTPDDNGFEMLRLRRAQFGWTKRDTMSSTLMKIVQKPD